MPAITIMFGEMRPIDEMMEGEGGAVCPAATQDDDANSQAMAEAEEEYGYTEASSDEESCASCRYFDQSAKMKKCIGDKSGAGYCHELRFCCDEEFVCDEFEAGDPVSEDEPSGGKDVF